MFMQVDGYGTQQPIALLKLLLDRGGIYDREKDLNYKILKDLGFIAAMGKAGGGRNDVDPRFISLFGVFSIPFPAVDSLHLIYSSIIKGHTRVSFFFPQKSESQSFISSGLINLVKSFRHLKTSYRRFVIKSLSAHWNCTTTSLKICRPRPPNSITSST